MSGGRLRSLDSPSPRAPWARKGLQGPVRGQSITQQAQGRRLRRPCESLTSHFLGCIALDHTPMVTPGPTS